MTKEQEAIIETINNIPALLDGNKVSEEDSIKISVALVKAVQALKQPFEQIEWERNIAIKQLKDLGYSLGEKKKTCKDCKRWSNDNAIVIETEGNPTMCLCHCDLLDVMSKQYFSCDGFEWRD